MNYYVLGKNVRKARKSLNMTQEQLSEYASISTVFISQIENGARKPSLETLYNLSIILNVSMDELVKNTTDTELTEDTTEINTLLNSRTKNEIRFITAVVKTILSNLNQDKIIGD